MEAEIIDALSDSETKFIRDAVAFLEQPSRLIQVAAIVGKPAEWLMQAAPKRAGNVAEYALRACMDWVAGTVVLPEERPFKKALDASWWSGFYTRLSAGVSGAIGGAFGLPGLAIELPITTAIMLRSVAAIASEFGANLTDPGVRLECLSIFSFGGPNPNDDQMDSAFFTSKAAMAAAIKEAARCVAGKTPAAIAAAVADGSASVLVRLIAQIASRFEVAVTEKFVAQSLPVIGAVSGAAVNAAFAGYFNDVAKYHFGIARLQHRYGEAKIESLYKAELAVLRKTFRSVEDSKVEAHRK